MSEDGVVEEEPVVEETFGEYLPPAEPDAPEDPWAEGRAATSGNWFNPPDEIIPPFVSPPIDSIFQVGSGGPLRVPATGAIAGADRNLASDGAAYTRRYYFESKNMYDAGDMFINWLLKRGVLEVPTTDPSASIEGGESVGLLRAAQMGLQGSRQLGGATGDDLLSPLRLTEGEGKADLRAWAEANWHTDPKLTEIVQKGLASSEKNTMYFDDLIPLPGVTGPGAQQELDIISGILDDFVEEVTEHATMAFVGTSMQDGQELNQAFILSYDNGPYGLDSVFDLFSHGSFGPMDAVPYLDDLRSRDEDSYLAIQSELYGLGYLNELPAWGEVDRTTVQAFQQLQTEVLNHGLAAARKNRLVHPEELRQLITNDRLNELTKGQATAQERVDAALVEELTTRVSESLEAAGVIRATASGTAQVNEQIRAAIAGANERGDTMQDSLSHMGLSESLLSQFYDVQDLSDSERQEFAWQDNIEFGAANTAESYLGFAARNGALDSKWMDRLGTDTTSSIRNQMSPDEVKAVAVSNLAGLLGDDPSALTDQEIAERLMQYGSLMGIKQARNQQFGVEDYVTMARNGRQSMNLNPEFPDFVDDLADEAFAGLGVEELGSPLSSVMNAIDGKLFSGKRLTRSRTQNV